MLFLCLRQLHAVLLPQLNYLIIFRAIQGIGGALMIPGSLSIIQLPFKSERGKAIGTWSAITTMVTIGGPILGGALADAGLWRMIFFINIPIGIASFDNSLAQGARKQ